MNANFEQAFTILKTLNIDLQGFNTYLNNKLNANAIKKDIKEVIKKELVVIIPPKSKRWADYDDSVDSDGISYSETASCSSDTTSSSTDVPIIPTTSSTISKPLNYLSIVSSAKEDAEGFEQYSSKKIQKKHVVLSSSTNPMFKDYGLNEDQTVFDKKDMSTAIKEKWTIGTDFQIHPDAFCPTLMEGCHCSGYCDYVHLYHCKFETESKKCTNSKCTFLHSRDMPTKESRSNFQRNLKKC